MIIIMGIAGTGKSTQAKLLSAKLSCPRLSTGQLLRDNMSGAEVQEMLAGQIVSDDKLLPLLELELKRIQADKNEFILDGSPRSMRQAQWLANKIKDGNLKLTGIIHLQLSEAVAKERLLQRGRADDHLKAIAERFREYDQSILPILSYLKTQNFVVHEVSAEGSELSVANNIAKSLGL